MSETTTAPAAAGGSPKVARISEAVIRIAGNSQDGIQAIGGFLARLAGRSEQEVMTFMTIPATISGGPSIFQDRIGSLKNGGIVLFDSDHVEPKPELKAQFHHLGVPISSLTVEAIGGTAKD